MAGQVKRMIDSIIQQRAKGDPMLIVTTGTKLILKGLNPARFNSASPDDLAVIARVRVVAAELGINI
jgi:hypothetical protein